MPRSAPATSQAQRRTAQTEPVAQLVPRATQHRSYALLMFALGAVGAGVLGLQQEALLAGVAFAAGVVLAVVVWRNGARKVARDRIQDLLVEALANYTGARKLDRRTVTLTKWTGRGVGIPQRVMIRYAPGVPDGDPNWRPAVLDVLQRRLDRAYKVGRHDRSRCRLHLVPDDTSAGDAPPYAQVRLERAITSLVGPSTKIAEFEANEDGDIIRVHVDHEESAKCAVAGFRLRAERTVSAMMPGRWRANWDLEGDKVTFEQRPSLPTSIWLPIDPIPDDVDDLLLNYRKVKIPVGEDEDGRRIWWHPALVPQALISGGTGSGKTSTVHAIIATITRYGWPVWILDAKRIEFLDHRDWPNVQIVATTLEQQVALVHRVWQLMEYRYQLIEEGKVRVDDLEPLVVILDEYAEFVANLLDWYATVKVKGDPTKPRTLQEVGSLARKARTARIHLIISMQRPDVALLGGAGGETRSNFGQRISMGRLDPAGAMMMWENAYTGVAIPRGVTGRAMAVNDQGVPVETQCYRFPSMYAEPGSEEALLLQQLKPTAARHERLVIIPPGSDQESFDLDTGEPIPLTFSDYQQAEWALASSRPDLDLALAGTGDEISPEHARALSSTLAALGLDPNLPSSGRRRVAPGLFVDEAHDEDEPFPEHADQYIGYGAPIHLPPSRLEVGDLIQVEEGSGEWVVIDEDPEEDAFDPACIAVSWRSDTDECGSLSLPASEPVAVRRPDID